MIRSFGREGKETSTMGRDGSPLFVLFCFGWVGELELELELGLGWIEGVISRW